MVRVTTIKVYLNRLELVLVSIPEVIIEDVFIYDGTDFEIMDGIEYLRNFAESSNEYRFTNNFNSQKLINTWQRENTNSFLPTAEYKRNLL